MPDWSLQALLQPIAADSPCGDPLEYDPRRLELDELLARQPLHGAAVQRCALALCRRTKHLAVAVALARAATVMDGASGCVVGLRLVTGLLSRHWVDLHPRLDADGAATRATALSGLQSPRALPRELSRVLGSGPAPHGLMAAIDVLEATWNRHAPELALDLATLRRAAGLVSQREAPPADPVARDPQGALAALQRELARRDAR